MPDFEPLAKVAGKVFTVMAEKYYPEGSVVRCIPCGKQRNCTTSEIATWMASGFPKCKVCGHTIDLVNPWIQR